MKKKCYKKINKINKHNKEDKMPVEINYYIKMLKIASQVF